VERRIPVIGIIGLGLIGGSVGLALRAHGGWRVVGHDRLEEVRVGAIEIGACDDVAASVEDLARESDIVMVATPSSLIPETGLLAARFMRRGAILTDAGSVKLPLQELIAGALPVGVKYIGGHPMAGSERSGLPAASPGLFRGAVWALTAFAADREALDEVQALVRATGANPLVVDAGEHDAAVAYASHLPYVLAVALALSVERKTREIPLVRTLLAGGFRDTTRLARSDPRIAMDYCALNRGALLEAIAEFEECLRSMKADLEAVDYRALESEAERARGYLEGLSRKG